MVSAPTASSQRWPTSKRSENGRREDVVDLRRDVEDNPKMTKTLCSLIALAVVLSCGLAVPAVVHARAAQGGQTMIPAPPDVAAPPADAKKTASGLAYKVLQPG